VRCWCIGLDASRKYGDRSRCDARASCFLLCRFAVLALVGDSVRETPGRPSATTMLGHYCMSAFISTRQTLAVAVPMSPNAVTFSGTPSCDTSDRGRQRENSTTRDPVTTLSRAQALALERCSRIACTARSTLHGRPTGTASPCTPGRPQASNANDLYKDSYHGLHGAAC